MDVQTFVPERPIETLYKSIIRRLARPTEVHSYAVVICPHINQTPCDSLPLSANRHVGLAR